MKNLKLICLFILTVILSNCSENKNTSNDEQAIKDLMVGYDEAAMKKDMNFFEANLASDYHSSSAQGNFVNRDTVIKYIKEDLENPSYKLVSLKSDSIQVKFIGDAAVVTGKWLSTVQALDDSNPIMHNDEGRYTSILEKRDGKWMMVAEHVSERPHNKKVLETELKAASDSYDNALLKKDKNAISELFADDYASTGRQGKLTNKSDEITQIMSTDLVIESSITDDKNFRLYRNTAVETGRFTVNGTYKGESFSEVGRYTTTWIYRDGKWRIVADHTSLIPDSN